MLGIYFVEVPYVRINMIDRDPIRKEEEEEEMSKKLVWVMVSLLVVSSMLVASCATEEVTPTTAPTAIPTEKAAEPTEAPEPTAVPTEPPTVEANWWDEWGEPEYGGTLTIRTTFVNPGSFDPTAGMMGRSGPMKRPAITLLAPWIWKKRVPRSIRPG